MNVFLNNIIRRFYGLLVCCFLSFFLGGNQVRADEFYDPAFSEDAQSFVRQESYESPTFNNLESFERPKPVDNTKSSSSSSFKWERVKDVLDIVVPMIIVILIFILVFSLIRYFSKERSSDELGGDELDMPISHTIYNHDFLSELEMLSKKGNFSEAVRVVYLAALHGLNEKQLVKWDDSKTPTDYYYEIANDKVRPVFFSLANIFLQARFDDVIADANMLQLAKDSHNEISRLTANKLML